MDSFSKYHASINFLYFIVMFAGTVILMNPVIILITLGSTIMYYPLLGGSKELRKILFAGGMLAILSLILNPLFNHRGETILGYFAGNLITKESIVYSFVISIFLVSVLYLFACFQAVITEEKITLLFGTILPKMALCFTMALSLIPKLSRDYSRIRGAHKGFRKQSPFANISCLLGIALEDSLETADSMAARGYLLKRRKTYVVAAFSKRDGRLLTILMIMIVGLLMLGTKGDLKVQYFPYIIWPSYGIYEISFYIVFVFFAVIPTLLYGKEKLRWKIR